MNRPFRNSGYGGAALLGEGINQGVNSFAKNFLDMKRQLNADKYAEIDARSQAVDEGWLQAQQRPVGQPPVDAGGGGAAVLATPPTPTPLAPGVRLGPPGSANYADPTLGTPEPMNEGPPSPYFHPMAQPGVTPDPRQLQAQAPVGAQALAGPAPSAPKSVDQLSLDELRELSFQHATTARENALANETDIDMLQKAFHYNQLMSVSKPHLDQWAKALNEVKANPTNRDKWRGVQVLTGEEDPEKALALATKQYSDLRGQHEEYSKNYTPLNEQLTQRGITPDLYENEAKFLQFRNQRKFQPHSPSGRGAGVLKTPKPARR